MNLQPTDYKCAQNDFLMLHHICFRADNSSFFRFYVMDYSLAFRAVVALLSHFCRTCKRYHKQDARANEGSASRIKPASSTHDGESQTHPNRERGYNKPFTPCPAGNMGLTPTPCGHSRECPAQTKRQNFPEQIKRQSTSPAQSPLWTVFLYAWFFSLIRSKVLSRLFAAAASAD